MNTLRSSKELLQKFKDNAVVTIRDLLLLFNDVHTINNDVEVLKEIQPIAETAATIKTKYESNPNTNAYTDAEKTKLTALNSKIDKQSISASDVQNTVNTEFSDVPGMTLTTKNLGESGNYSVEFLGSFQHSLANVNISVIINADGADIPTSAMPAGRSSINGNFVLPAIADPVLANAKIIKVRWKTPSGTATITNRTLRINGVAVSNIVP